MVAASGIPARHSKGMLLTLHDTRACRENPGRTWMHRLCDGGMQKCMDEISRGWKQQKISQPELWSEAWIGRRTKAGILESSSGDYRTHVWRLELCANAPHLQFQKSPRRLGSLWNVCAEGCCMKRFQEWGKIKWSLHQLVTSEQSLKMPEYQEQAAFKLLNTVTHQKNAL